MKKQLHKIITSLIKIVIDVTIKRKKEMRKVTANRIFENINAQEGLIEQALNNWMNNEKSIKNLCGYN